VDISLVVVILYHAGYGLVSFTGDYLASRSLRMGLAGLVILVMLLCAVVGVRLTILI
jgi:succinate dehydrogenase hydrophobic anchor subunit